MTAKPASAKAQTYSLTYPYGDFSDDSFIMNVAKDGSDVYFGGVFENMPDAWVKGTLEGDKVTFEPQYMGVDTITQTHVSFYPATIDSTYVEYFEDGEDYSYWDTEVNLSDKTPFNYDATTGIFKTDSLFVVNQGNKVQNSLVSFSGATLVPWTEKAATPQDPIIDEFSEYTEEGGYGYAVFTIPLLDTDGNVMDSKQMYYNIYFDDEVQTLYTDEYRITEDVTDIPYALTDNNSLFSSASEKTLYFFSTGFKKFGVQSAYTGGGETHKSNIVYYEIASNITDAVGNVGVKKVAYTDLCGRRVLNPSNGVFIKSVTFADGSTKVTKVICR